MKVGWMDKVVGGTLDVKNFFLQFCDVNWSGNHPQDGLAKFGYMLYMKVERETRNFLYSWLPIGTSHNNMVIWISIFIFLKIWWICAIFPHEKSFG